jgi:ssDNA-binding Zn-finger/Zn-ribbon topoisomerase 1
MSESYERSFRSGDGSPDLRVFRITTVIYEATLQFCGRFLEKRSRMVEPMIEAARSARQNLADGSRASGDLFQTESRLVDLARASLDELLLSYEDFLRQRGLRQWTNEDPQAQAVRALALRGPSSASDRSGLHDYAIWLETTAPGLVANAIICLIHQANDLLHQRTRVPEHAPSTADGARELQSEPHASTRFPESLRQSATDPGPADSPTRPTSAYIPGAPGCPKCGKIMALRTVRKGTRPGSQFWGCSAFPNCKGVRNI